MSIHPPQFPGTHRTPLPRTLIDIILSVAATHPEAPALDDGRRSLSYTELVSEMRALGFALHEAGVGPGDKVGVRVSRGTLDLYVLSLIHI